MNYKDFLKTKFNYGESTGMDKFVIHEKLFDFQNAIVSWACKKGRSAIFADTGLGKTFMQLDFAKNAISHSKKDVIIFAPLAVNEQTIKEAEKINLEVSRYDSKNPGRIQIANYENLDNIDIKKYDAVILDESSILKSLDGVTRGKLISLVNDNKIQFRLACTATPAPNDITEIGNHAEFLGVMKREEMLAKFFFNNGSEWEIKGHAVDAFYKWIATWAMFIKYPSDLGFKDNGFKLPQLNFHGKFFDYEFHADGTLFDIGLKGIEDRIKIRKDTIVTKAQTTADFINAEKHQHVVWCGLNQESDVLTKLIDNAENLQGSDSDAEKIRKINDFKTGKLKVLITKPKIAGYGLNFQNCNNVSFFGLSDSYEIYYQCIRRCYRFGQKKEVNVYLWLAGNEKEILSNVQQKEEHAQSISRAVISHVRDYEKQGITGQKHNREDYMTDKLETEHFTSYLGDSCEVWKTLPDNSIDFTVFSPPFASLYTYSSSERDLGNSKNGEDFFEHFSFLIKELKRTTKQGRLVAVHCMNLPTKLMSDGYIGIKDFRGDIIRAFIKEGMIYHSEVCIQKNPQVAAIRTHAKGLMFKQMHKDSSESRMGLADYVCVFKKEGKSEIPIDCDLSNDEWIKFAHPIWTDIRETYTLNSRQTKAEKDEKHICPLQLDVIERCIRLWSNKGEVVASPFGGIGSEGYVAIKQGRKALLCELKPEYFEQQQKNLKKAINDSHGLFGDNTGGLA